MRCETQVSLFPGRPVDVRDPPCPVLPRECHGFGGEQRRGFGAMGVDRALGRHPSGVARGPRDAPCHAHMSAPQELRVGAGVMIHIFVTAALRTAAFEDDDSRIEE